MTVHPTLSLSLSRAVRCSSCDRTPEGPGHVRLLLGKDTLSMFLPCPHLHTSPYQSPYAGVPARVGGVYVCVVCACMRPCTQACVRPCARLHALVLTVPSEPSAPLSPLAVGTTR